MAFDETVKVGLTRLFEAKMALKISLVVLVLTIIFQVVSLSINDWIKSDSQNEGLWNTCATVGNVTCCTSISDAPAFLGATRAFLIMTVLICMPVMVLLRCIEIKNSDKENTITQVVYTLFAVLAVIFLLLASSIYGGMYGDRNVQGSKLSVGFGLCATGMFLIIFEGILVCCDT